MGRPREFDETEALDAAMQCFWARGYEATSMRDLAERMGITGASLYNAFGDKRRLFRRGLEHYLDRGVRECIARLRALPPRDAIAAYFDEVIARTLADHEQRGCMLVNCTLELGAHTPALRHAVAAELGEIEGFFHDRIEAGQADGTIARGRPAVELARHLLAVVLGLNVLTRARPDRGLLEDVVRPALALLDIPPSAGRDAVSHPKEGPRMDTHIDTAPATPAQAATSVGVEADLHYLAPMPERPFTYAYEPPAGTPRTNAVYEARRVLIRNARPNAADLRLDRAGFALVRHASAVRDFYDEDELRRVYYPEAERLVAEATGAARVVVFDHTIRRRIWGAEDRSAGTPRQPVPRVHNDYTEASAPQRVRDLMGAEADALLAHRFEIINVWRPIRGPLQDSPLAMADAASVDPADLVVSDLIYRDRRGETCAVLFNPNHRWFYAPDMQPDEAWLLKCFDSARDGRARLSPHTAFEDPTAPADMSPRESIELRTLVLHDA